MWKKVLDWVEVIILLVALCLLSSCNWCEDTKCNRCGYVYDNELVVCPRCGYSQHSGDYFSAGTLVGEWQMSNTVNTEKAYMNGCGIIPKGIVFSNVKGGNYGFKKCTMTYAIDNEPQWYEADLLYNYVRRELTFYYINEYGKEEKLFAFTYKDFLFPTLTVQDSFGTYEWRKIRVTTSY
jgi:hypothetical protein